MANITYAREWLTFSKKNLDTAVLLFEADHYEDIIGIEIQQSLEKLLKTVMAYQNIKITRDHDLVKLYYIVEDICPMDDDAIVLLRIATDYYKEDRYPNPYYSLPNKREIEEILYFAKKLFDKISTVLQIDINEIK